MKLSNPPIESRIPLVAFLNEVPTKETWVSKTMLDTYARCFLIAGWACESEQEINKVLGLIAEEGLIWIDTDYKGRVRQIKRVYNINE